MLNILPFRERISDCSFKDSILCVFVILFIGGFTTYRPIPTSFNMILVFGSGQNTVTGTLQYELELQY
jgi:hypothetical protein